MELGLNAPWRKKYFENSLHLIRREQSFDTRSNFIFSISSVLIRHPSSAIKRAAGPLNFSVRPGKDICHRHILQLQYGIFFYIKLILFPTPNLVFFFSRKIVPRETF